MLPTYVMKKHFIMLNKILKKENKIKGIGKMKKDEVTTIFKNLFKMKNGSPMLKKSKSKMIFDIKNISELNLPIYNKYVGKIKKVIPKIPKEHKQHHTKKHIKIMENEMKKGKSFNEAHNIAVKQEKKPNESKLYK